jgi:hypothetical protein
MYNDKALLGSILLMNLERSLAYVNHALSLILKGLSSCTNASNSNRLYMYLK